MDTMKLQKRASVSAMLDPKIFGNGDLNVFDGVPIPERFKNRIREAERQEILHRLFAEVMIDAVDLGFLDIAMQGRIQAAGRVKVAAEWFLEHDANPSMTFEQSRFVQPLHRIEHGVRWQRQVEHSVLRHAVRELQPTNVGGQRLIILWPSFMQALVVKTLLAPDAQLCFIARAPLTQTFEGPLPKPLFAHFRQGGADDQRVACFQGSLVPQMKQRRQELSTC